MNKKNSIQEELNEMPLLKEQLGQAEGYRVPDGYFKELEKNILDQVHQEIIPTKSARTKLFSLSSIWGKAAAIALLIGGSLWVWQNNTPSTIAATTDLSTEEVYTYIRENLQEFDEDLLLDQVSAAPAVLSDLSEAEQELFLEELMEDTSFDLEDIL